MNRQEKREAKAKFVEALEMTNEQIGKISDGEIRKMETIIKLYSPSTACYGKSSEVIVRQSEVQTILKTRLNELSEPKPQPKSQCQRTETLCDCRHFTSHPMTTSFGTSCPICYDRMSG